MRVNIYAEELTDKVEIIEKEIEGSTYSAVRFYLELPATVDGKQYQGPFMHRPGDDDSSAVTFWGKKKLRDLLVEALRKLDEHHAQTSKEKVLAVHPSAYMAWTGHIWIERGVHTRKIGTSWQNAAESLPAEPEQEASLEK